MGHALKLKFPSACHVGPGAVRALGEEAARLGRRALLVTGRHGLRRAGITERLTTLLQEAGVAVTTFEEVRPEPDVGTVDAARAAIRESECDLVVEAGGGSALDVGKVAAALAGEEAPTAQFHTQSIESRGLPHVAIPTTSGTGAEATPNGVLTAPGARLKQSIRGAGVLPTVAIVDPDLTLACPPGATAAAGMDALVQGIESYLSVHAIPTTDALALASVRLTSGNLLAVWRDGQDHDARAAMSEGSFLAGLALANARLGAVHGIAHPLGLCLGLPHGVVCGALMPPVLRRNRAAAGAKYEALREAMGGEPVRVLESLLDGLSLPRRLGARPKGEWERIIVDYAVRSGSSRANPVAVSESFVLAVLDEVCV
ncbi:MAG: iron-containing alcohol dehydrogenase [Candidatus Brocadiaceae bacterium]|nr:iron-containing alcohol dehydrogenase [Candidatus Brocadiaceae bacterium]